MGKVIKNWSASGTFRSHRLYQQSGIPFLNMEGQTQPFCLTSIWPLLVGNLGHILSLIPVEMSSLIS